MSDVNCPYCSESQEINHDDGYGYEDGGVFEQNCVSCGKEFKFVTSISFTYETLCNGDHDLEQSPVARFPHLYSCTRCDYFESRRPKDSNEQK
jgi:Zn ribbon nucleic-acid-binding protein